MADVLIVCVREDEPQAKALAEMFEAAGFSVGGAPSNDAALRSSGAGLIVWSQASIRSRPFLDAAQRVINANKAVVASLIEPPPPSSIGDAQAFDLSEWSGDPNDPSLDPLFFAIDRMVNSARAEVQTAPARQAPQAYAPPPRTAPPAPPPQSYARRSPPPAPQPTYTRTPPPAPERDLGSEAEHWRAIRDSRDPADFMDYLARYGAEGAFADVAELRLNQLTSKTEVRQPPAPRPPPPPMRADPPPPRRAETPRFDPPPQRRPDPPPSPRRREPAYERSYERAGEHRETPTTGGGAMRAFILIALLGGLALAGGLYFGGGLGELGGTRTAQNTSEEVPATPPVGEEPATAEDQNTQSGVAVSDVAETTQPTAQERRQAELQRQRDEQQRRQQQQQEDGPTPQPTASWTAPQQQASNTGGPVSLRPGEQQNSGSSAVVPIPPSVTAPDPQTVSTTTTTTAPPLRTAATGNVLWAARPSASRISDLYPSRALRANVGGRVELDCTVQASLALTCTIARESPADLGFGRSALTAASSYRARPELSNGASSVGARTRIAIQFQAPSE